MLIEQGLHPWLTPQWPSPARVRAVFTTRVGGVSAQPFDQLNVGLHVGDDPAAVLDNRQRVRDVLERLELAQQACEGWPQDAAAAPLCMPFLQQVHGTKVLLLGGESDSDGDGDGMMPPGLAAGASAVVDVAVADAALTRTPGMVCTVMVADCLPVLLARQDGTAVAAVHAGWRGLAGVAGAPGVGVVEEAVHQLCQGDGRAGAAPSPAAKAVPAHALLAWLGPCIGPQAFEVGADVVQAFCQHHEDAYLCFQPGVRAGAWWADLAGLARLRLRALGVTAVYGNDSTLPWCTVAQREQFFSYRRDQQALGGSGRMAAAIWIGHSLASRLV